MTLAAAAACGLAMTFAAGCDSTVMPEQQGASAGEAGSNAGASNEAGSGAHAGKGGSASVVAGAGGRSDGGAAGSDAGASNDPSAAGSEAGAAGAGPVASCSGAQQMCVGACTDTAVDPNHCGTCANVCAAGQLCSNGQCATTCAAPTSLCEPNAQAAYCANLTSDQQNCGVCGTACAAGMACSGSSCSLSCAGSQINCGGTCIEPSTDRVHCGATAGCGLDAAGSAGTACVAGTVCVGGSCEANCGASLLKCGDSCVDKQDDPNHCGDCDTQCKIPNGMNVCASGQCALLACNTNFSQCPPSYTGLPITACAKFSTDLQNCGYCGHACALANAVSACTTGQCTIAQCNTGYLDCNKDPSDGCETAGTVCPSPKTVFITSTTYSANLGGYVGADAKCAAAATAASLAGTFVAWISDGAITPLSRFTQSTVPYALVDGTIIANNWTALIGGPLRHSISLNEAGAAAPAAVVRAGPAIPARAARATRI